MKNLVNILAVAATAVLIPQADAQSSNAAWRFENLIGLSAASGGTSDTVWVDVLTTHIKTPNGKELAIGAGVLSVETIRLVKDANGTTDLSNLN